MYYQDIIGKIVITQDGNQAIIIDAFPSQMKYMIMNVEDNDTTVIDAIKIKKIIQPEPVGVGYPIDEPPYRIKRKTSAEKILEIIDIIENAVLPTAKNMIQEVIKAQEERQKQDNEE